jgi:hypothetical protein
MSTIESEIRKAALMLPEQDRATFEARMNGHREMNKITSTAEAIRLIEMTLISMQRRT